MDIELHTKNQDDHKTLLRDFADLLFLFKHTKICLTKPN